MDNSIQKFLQQQKQEFISNQNNSNNNNNKEINQPDKRATITKGKTISICTHNI